MKYRDCLIANGAITPRGAGKARELADHVVLRLDDRGRAQALKNIELGDNGHLVMEMPFGLGLWHEKALELREKRERAAAKKLN